METMTDRALFDLYRNYIKFNNPEGTRDIIREFGRREATTLNGELFEDVFSRNPQIKVWYDEGKLINSN